jgi:hypothetical protein
VPRDESVWSDERLPVTDARRAEEEREPTEACDAASLTRFGVRFSMLSSASRMRTSSPPPARGENTGCASGENGIRAPAPALRPACVGVDGASCMAKSWLKLSVSGINRLKMDRLEFWNLAHSQPLFQRTVPNFFMSMYKAFH